MYHVDWLRSALNEPADLWNHADTDLRKAITEASNAIDQRLSQAPLAEGESREGITRIAFIGPFTVRFQVEADGTTVSVLHVHIPPNRVK